MRAARWHGRRDVRIDDVPEPRPRVDEVVVEVSWCGICGTDLEEFRAGPVALTQTPITLGHEFVGTVVEAAGDGRGPPVGARVVPDQVVSCGSCWWCRRHQEHLCPDLKARGLDQDGGLARYMAARADTCVPIPDSLSDDVAALAEPVSVAVRAVRKIPSPMGCRVLVTGAGTIGLLVLQVLRASGAGLVLVSDPVAWRRDLAVAFGADHALAPDDADTAVSGLTGTGPDIVVECSGAPGMSARAVKLCRSGGLTVLVGFHGGTEPLDLLDATLKEKQILGSGSHLWDEDVTPAVRLLGAGQVRVDDLITSRIALDDIVERGFQVLDDPTNRELKVLVQPS